MSSASRCFFDDPVDRLRRLYIEGRDVGAVAAEVLRDPSAMRSVREEMSYDYTQPGDFEPGKAYGDIAALPLRAQVVATRWRKRRGERK